MEFPKVNLRNEQTCFKTLFNLVHREGFPLPRLWRAARRCHPSPSDRPAAMAAALSVFMLRENLHPLDGHPAARNSPVTLGNPADYD
jgi:hypothetical protein